MITGLWGETSNRRQPIILANLSFLVLFVIRPSRMASKAELGIKSL